METNLQNLLSGIIISFAFGIGAVIFFILAVKRIGRFFMMDYQGNSKERFKDNLLGNIYMALGIACILPAFFSFQYGNLKWDILSVSLCFGAIILPIGILGAYWRSYTMNKLWGGFMPLVREQYGYAQPQSSVERKIDMSKIKLSRRTTITAALVALLGAVSIYFVLYISGWNGSPLSGIIFRIFVSGLLALGIFMRIGSVALSRKIQKLRDGEVLDEDDNS